MKTRLLRLGFECPAQSFWRRKMKDVDATAPDGRAADRMVTRKATLSSGKILILCYRVRPEVCMRCFSVTAREVIVDDQGIKIINGYEQNSVIVSLHALKFLLGLGISSAVAVVNCESLSILGVCTTRTRIFTKFVKLGKALAELHCSYYSYGGIKADV